MPFDPAVLASSEENLNAEVEYGKNLIDACNEVGVKFFVWRYGICLSQYPFILMIVTPNTLALYRVSSWHPTGNMRTLIISIASRSHSSLLYTSLR